MTPSPPRPHLGLVCITASDEVRFRTITRTRYLSLSGHKQRETLEDLYRDNLKRLFHALDFCCANGIHLYRVTSQLFPMSDLEDGVGLGVLDGMRERLAEFGPRADELGVRVVVHPDQYVVLSSDSPEVVANSLSILARHAMTFDLLGLPRSSWATMTLHGGKAGRSERLIEAIGWLPEGVRSRLGLENDERAYGAADILKVCRAANVPMVFDAHHHIVKEGLSSYGDPSVADYVAAARDTWPDPGWQLVHLSNGRDGFNDNAHHDLANDVPPSYANVPWIEIEAKTKEVAIAGLRAVWPEAD